ncbi:PilN family type IVB pilus formation outer membrane protein [Crenobacter sp. SG2305]|uniref:PilN family type IVB pilus formation outer membrane protein n=1 Tax=Crenobacter oryzisoli TaxID=3056844 RepID=UPI0025AB5C8B|nr:PilN family type IVB pilus formation outer membrane protein [Crenobacter sp. SG2305]MDN0082479.1 PilN family type IVB pilus formation outer membrane protein [Crenobacter sp. SG2305]
MLKRLITVAVSGALLAGCAVHQQARHSINSEMDEAANLIADKRKQSMSNVERVEGIYLGDSPVRTKRPNLPSLFDKQFVFNKPVSDLNSLAEEITGVTGILCRVTDDALSPTGAGQSQQSGSSSSPAVPSPIASTGLPPPPPVPSSYGQAASSSQVQRTANVQAFSGSLTNFLNMATTRFGVSWKFDDGQIVIFAQDTRVFQLSSLPGDLDITSQVGNSATGGNGSNGGTTNSVTTSTQQSTTAKTKLTPWSSIEANVKSMLSTNGRVMSSPATNSLVVTDTPAILDRVSDYIDRENKRLSQRVDLYVKVYKVSVANGEDYGLDWAAVYKWLAKNTTIGLNRLSNLNTNGAGTTNLSFSIDPNSTSPWAGSQWMFKALATQGDVSEVTSAHVSPLNNRPAPVFVGKQVGYLAKVTTSNTQTTSSTALEPGTISTGFTMNLLPSVMERGRINLRYTMDLASLLRLDTVSSGGQIIQLPNIDSRSMMMDTVVKSGETLVIAGFEQSASNIAQEGSLIPGNILFGGTSQASKGKDVLVVVISSYLVNR